MQTQIKSQLYQEENIPINNSHLGQNQTNEINQEMNKITSSIPVHEKTKLPKDSKVYMNKSKIPGFQEVQINWSQRVAQQQIVAYQIYSEVNQIPQSCVQQKNNQQFSMPQSMAYQPGSGIPTRKNLTQIPKMRHSQYLQCKWCNQEVHSQVEYRIGSAQLLLCLFLLPAFGIGLIFVCCDTYKDCYHFCTNCSCEMGIVKLIGFNS
ncbi:unnamed protein product [Paramecium primaurelia]|uniref:LITAF domain-containing protein n=1 Tax=Paramecium primaurelia TaxID=5886 RepID=A0A8S1N091_PARPR|nr:unnamed protein product [Paramecium primaurelia]